MIIRLRSLTEIEPRSLQIGLGYLSMLSFALTFSLHLRLKFCELSFLIVLREEDTHSQTYSKNPCG